MRSQFEDAYEDSQKIKEDFIDAARQVREDVADYATVAAERAEQQVRKAGRQAAIKGRELDELAHEHAWVVAGVAAAVGVLIGMLLSRRSRD